MGKPIKTVVDAQTTSCMCCGRPWRIVRLSCGHEFPTYEFDDEWDGALLACRQCPEEEAVTS